jgi:hypothetical protein
VGAPGTIIFFVFTVTTLGETFSITGAYVGVPGGNGELSKRNFGSPFGSAAFSESFGVLDSAGFGASPSAA